MIPSEPGGYTRARRRLSLSSVVRDALPVMRVAVANTAVLRIAIDAHAPLVEVNAIAMQRVLMKLVLNASQAIRAPHGVIEIGVAGMISPDYPNRPFVRLTVADNGIGMDSATVGNLRQQLLEPADSYAPDSVCGLSIGPSAPMAGNCRLTVTQFAERRSVLTCRRHHRDPESTTPAPAKAKTRIRRGINQHERECLMR